MILKSCTFCLILQTCRLFIYKFVCIILSEYIQHSNIKKHISAESCLEKGLLLFSEKYRYEVVGEYNMSFPQLKWALLRGKQLSGGLSLPWLYYLFLSVCSYVFVCVCVLCFVVFNFVIFIDVFVLLYLLLLIFLCKVGHCLLVMYSCGLVYYLIWWLMPSALFDKTQFWRLTKFPLSHISI